MKIIKVSHNMYVYQKGRYVYKKYKLNSILWMRELNIINFIHNKKGINFKYKNIIKIVGTKICNDNDFTIFENKIFFQKNKCQYFVIKYRKYTNFTGKKINTTQFIKFIVTFLMINDYNFILHRDLKEQNFLIKNKCYTNDVFLLIDYGLSIIKCDNVNHDMSFNICTKTYKPPELNKSGVHGDYGNEVAVWSIGIILFQHITGSHPSKGVKLPNNNKELTYLVQSCLQPKKHRITLKNLISELQNYLFQRNVHISTKFTNNLQCIKKRIVENMTCIQYSGGVSSDDWILDLHNNLLQKKMISYSSVIFFYGKMLKMCERHLHKLKYLKLSLYIMMLLLFTDKIYKKFFSIIKFVEENYGTKINITELIQTKIIILKFFNNNIYYYILCNDSTTGPSGFICNRNI